MLGKLPQASRDIYDDSAQSDNDRDHHKNNGGITFGACPGIETNQTGEVQ